MRYYNIANCATPAQALAAFNGKIQLNWKFKIRDVCRDSVIREFKFGVEVTFVH
jgi:hypothetical protein